MPCGWVQPATGGGLRQGGSGLPEGAVASEAGAGGILIPMVAEALLALTGHRAGPQFARLFQALFVGVALLLVAASELDEGMTLPSG